MNGEGAEPAPPRPEGLATELPAAPDVGNEVEEVEPDEVVFRITDDRAVVFSAAGQSRWGQWLGQPSARELASLLRALDPAARAAIEAKRLTGALVELHPTDREMFGSGFKTIGEDGGWLQANFRDRGQVTRLMRIRPATGTAAVSGGALVLAAVAAQTQAAELGRDVKAIGQRVEQLHKGVEDDLAGAVDNVARQVEDLVELLQAHGADGASESDVSIVRHALGETNQKCLRRLATAVEELESAAELPSATGAEEVVTAGAANRVMLYRDLVHRLETATIQFSFAQVAFDCHTGHPHVAVTRAAQVTRQVGAFRHDVENASIRLTQLHGSVREQFLPWWKLAGKEVAASAGMAAAGAGGGAVLAAAPAAADAAKDGGSGDGPRLVAGAAAAGAALGLATGIIRGAKKTVHEVRAKAPLQERLAQLATAGTKSLETNTGTPPALDWLQHLTKELAAPDH